jgi:TetR/AcrR family transcriptional regulator
MEKFSGLPLEKQNVFINAALICFGTNGYKKASIGDIAKTAGVSKALIFHYFGTKKSLYLYLIELCHDIFVDTINEKFDSSVTDFFDRIKLVTDIEISILEKYPAMLSFLKSMYFENNEDVKDDIKVMLANDKGENLRNKLYEGIDAFKFKDDVEPKMVIRILSLLTDGYLSIIPGTGFNLDALLKEFDEYMNLFKRNFYKEKYL